MSDYTPQPYKILIAIGILFILGYGVFNSRFLIKGPELSIEGLEDSSDIIHAQTRDFNLQGNATHSAYISLNNRPILIDENGNFNEKLLLSNGVSVIDIYAKDKFGKEVRKKIDVVYSGETPSSALSYEKIALYTDQASSSDEVTEEESEGETEDVTASSSSGL